MTKSELATHAIDALIDESQGKDNVSAADLVWEIDRLSTPDYTPDVGNYEDTINSLESDYWREAEDYIYTKTYGASQWFEAQEAWANALELAAFSSLFEDGRQVLRDEIFDFDDYITGTLQAPEDVKITITRECRFGWAPHDRETEEGIHIWERLEGEFKATAVEALPGLWINAVWWVNTWINTLK